MEHLDCRYDPHHPRSVYRQQLYVAMNLPFAYSLCVSEILWLIWSNVYISDEDIADDNTYVCIDKDLGRVSKTPFEMYGKMTSTICSCPYFSTQ